MHSHALYALGEHPSPIDFRTHVLYHNAMTYHLYRDLFTRAEREALDASSKDEGSALSEINLLRIQLRRVFEASCQAVWARRKARRSKEEPDPLRPRLSMLATFAQSGMIMSSLVRVHLKCITSGLMYDPLDDLFPPGDVEDL